MSLNFHHLLSKEQAISLTEQLTILLGVLLNNNIFCYAQMTIEKEAFFKLWKDLAVNGSQQQHIKEKLSEL
jgi:hypothetical protein